MSKLYNKPASIASNFDSFFKSFSKSKTLLNFLSTFFYGLITSESSVNSEIALACSPLCGDVFLDSIDRRIRRFLSNERYDFHSIFDHITRDIISRLKPAHPNSSNNVHIYFDHSFVEEKYTVLMFSLRIGKQSIPLFFNIFPGKYQPGHGDAFRMKNIFAGILYCHNLIKKFMPNSNIIFLADRWFGNLFPLLNYIDSLNDDFVIRAKKNLKVFYFDSKENHKIWIDIASLPHYANHSVIYNNLEFTHKKYSYNLVYCKSNNHQEPWLLITNGNPKHAKAFYGYRFGAIEFLFKSQKTNGFYLEESCIKKFHSFENFYSLICLACTYLTCLGTEVSKNVNCYKNLGFRFTRKNNKTNNTYRIISRFRVGLILFKLAINSTKYYRLPFSFTLYDC